MKTWYQTKEINCVHKNCSLPVNAKIYLTEEQAKLHGQKVVKIIPPTSEKEAFIVGDFEEYEQDNEDTGEDKTAEPGEDKPSGVSPERGV